MGGDEEDQQTHVAGNDSVRAGVRPTVSGDDWANTVSTAAVSSANGDWGLPTTRAGRKIQSMVKALRCRLRLHDWDDRENPETHERYQVCLRCNAYRDRGRAAPGAGAAGVTGSGMG